MNYYGIILIAISLSLDAFSLSLAYGLMNFNKKKILFVSIVVGIFHFFMPLLGLNIGNYLFQILIVNPKIILSIMFSIIIIEMIRGINEDTPKTALNFIGTIIFALLVSVDSFSIGIGLAYITDNVIVASFIFSLSSFLFTLSGFFLGKYISIKFEKISKIIGIIIMFTLLIYYVCK